MITKLFDMLTLGKITNEEERQIFHIHAEQEDTYGFDTRLSFNQFHLPGWCELGQFNSELCFYNAFGKRVDSFEEATKDVFSKILEDNKDWILTQLKEGVYNIEHHHWLSYEFYLNPSTKELIVFECCNEDSHKNCEELIWLYRLESCFRDWEDYVWNSSSIDYNEIYCTMLTNIRKTYQKNRGIYLTSTGRYGSR